MGWQRQAELCSTAVDWGTVEDGVLEGVNPPPAARSPLPEEDFKTVWQVLTTARQTDLLRGRSKHTLCCVHIR